MQLQEPAGHDAVTQELPIGVGHPDRRDAEHHDGRGFPPGDVAPACPRAPQRDEAGHGPVDEPRQAVAVDERPVPART